MEFKAAAGSPGQMRSDCAIVGIFERREMTDAASQIDRRSRGRINAWLKRGDFNGTLGETLMLDSLPGVSSTRVLLVGLGPRKKYNTKVYRRVVTAAVRILAGTSTRQCVSWLADELPEGVTPYYVGRLTVEAAHNALYRIPDLKTSKKAPEPALRRITIGAHKDSQREVARGLSDGLGVIEGMKLTRDLGNLPANVCTPRYLAQVARDLAARHKSIKVTVHDERGIEKLKMGSFLSVTHGSAEPPRLIVFQYNGGKRGEAPVALVGKGITFDTGGISIKPSAAMDEMKFDMCGAATVFGVFASAAALKLPINLVGIVLACENMPSGTATKPGDIFTSMSGQTIEVLNTDAEGRLILADGLTYVREFKPEVVVDIATLTGACVIALGNHYTGLMSDDAELTAQLKAASERSGDGAWHLPMGEEYAEGLKSNFADMANVAGREGGAITAACFLAKFASGLRWAHLDIAGTAWVGGDKKSATGRPVPLLVDYLIERTRG